MKVYVDTSGNYLGMWDTNPPVNSIEVPTAPSDARQKWNAGSWRPLTQTDIDTQINAEAITSIGRKELKTLALILADLHGLTKAQIRQLYIDKYKSL